MAVNTVRRIAARVLGIGECRVRIDPEKLRRAEEALTADDVRALIKEGVVWAEPVKGVPRGRARSRHRKVKKGRMGGPGSRKGALFSRISAKEQWKAKIRAQRRLLRELRGAKRLKAGTYRHIYLMIKGNAFKSKAAMLAHLADLKLLKEAKGAGAAKSAAVSQEKKAE